MLLRLKGPLGRVARGFLSVLGPLCETYAFAMTQIEQARAGRVTPEMEAVAQSERLDPEAIRAEVARGRLVITANTGTARTTRIAPTAIHSQ